MISSNNYFDPRMSDYDCREAEAIHLLHPWPADDYGGGEDVPRRPRLREGRLAGGHREGKEEVGRGEISGFETVFLFSWETSLNWLKITFPIPFLGLLPLYSRNFGAIWSRRNLEI